MSVRVDYAFGPRRLNGAPIAKQPPQIAEALRAHRRAMEPQLARAKAEAARLRAEAQALRREARDLSGDAKKAKLELAKSKTQRAKEIVEDAQGLVGTDLMRISGVAGRRLLQQAEAHNARELEAGSAIPAAANATLWILEFGYGTHKSREAWLTDVPADGKVTFNVITSPSGHVGADVEACRRNLEHFARTNRYVAEVWHRAPDGSMRRLASYDFGVKKPPEYASISPDFEIDVRQLRGELVFRGWAQGSAGVGGYMESRETRVHLP